MTIAATLPIDVLQVGLESSKKTVVCVAAAVAIGAVLPYSFRFAFELFTYLAFLVTLAEGVLSILAELVDCRDYALRKAIEGIESLGASIVLLIASLATALA